MDADGLDIQNLTRTYRSQRLRGGGSSKSHCTPKLCFGVLKAVITCWLVSEVCFFGQQEAFFMGEELTDVSVFAPTHLSLMSPINLDLPIL